MLARALLAVVCLVFVGCGGEPCGGASFGTSNPSFAGDYTGSFDHATDTSQDAELAFNVSEFGQITGTANSVALESSSVIDWLDACGPSFVLMTLKWSPAGAPVVELSAGRPLGFADPWVFTVRDGFNGNVIGTLTLTRSNLLEAPLEYLRALESYTEERL